MSAAKDNFLKEHWDWVAAIVGCILLILSIVFNISGLGVSMETATDARLLMINARTPKNEGIEEVKIDVFDAVSRLASKPPEVNWENLRGASFLASTARYACRPGLFELKPKLSSDGEAVKGADGNPEMILVPTATGRYYACGKGGPVPLTKPCEGLPIAWADATNVCPFCHAYQYRDPAAVEKNEDIDGLDKVWKRKNGLVVGKDVANDDPDSDGFTNAEEYAAKTNPVDASSHPDYLDFVTLQGDIRHTYLPLYPSVANKVPDGKGGWTYRLTIRRLNAKTGEDKQVYVKVGDSIKYMKGTNVVDSGFVLTSYTPKTEQHKIAGSNAKRNVDVSEAVITRKADKKAIVTVLNIRKIPIEREVTLRFSRGTGETFKVRAGDKIKLMKRIYEVVSLNEDGQKSAVMLKDIATGRTRTISSGAIAAASGLD